MKIVKISLLSFTLAFMSFKVEPKISSTQSVKVMPSTLVWKTENIDLGEIPQNVPKEIVFEFKNTGLKAITITKVQPSCGCTAADYTKEAIAPGASGFIKATYNAANKGSFTKTVTVVTSDSDTQNLLMFKGTVI